MSMTMFEITVEESQGLAGGVLELLRERERLRLLKKCPVADSWRNQYQVAEDDEDDWQNMKDSLVEELGKLELWECEEKKPALWPLLSTSFIRRRLQMDERAGIEQETFIMPISQEPVSYEEAYKALDRLEMAGYLFTDMETNADDDLDDELVK
jgi:hypothetical protein